MNCHIVIFLIFLQRYQRAHVQDVNSWFVKLKIDIHFIKYIIQKGSVTLDGVSLTVNDVTNSEFNVMIIPHTYQNNIFKEYKIVSIVNIEIDMLAKYIEKLGNKND